MAGQKQVSSDKNQEKAGSAPRKKREAEALRRNLQRRKAPDTTIKDAGSGE